MSSSSVPPSYSNRSANFRICGDFGIPGFNNLGCGKSFQPDNEVMKVCSSCADSADRIVSQIELNKRDSQSQYGISGGARKRKRRAFDDQYADLLD